MNNQTDQTDEVAKHPGGRPTKYKPEYAKQVEKLCRIGATDAEIADFFEVSITTIWNWRAQELEFLYAIQKVEKEFADDRVQRSLYQRACGYSYDAVKIFNGPEGVVQVPYREHVPPDVAAGFIWLKNRRKSEWRDRYNDPEGPNNEVVIRVIGGLPEIEKPSSE
jgi:hypothetical protein